MIHFLIVYVMCLQPVFACDLDNHPDYKVRNDFCIHCTGNYQMCSIRHASEIKANRNPRIPENSSQNPKISSAAALWTWNGIENDTLLIPFIMKTDAAQSSWDAALKYFLDFETYPRLHFGPSPFLSAGSFSPAISGQNEKLETKTGIIPGKGVMLTNTGNFQLGILAGMEPIFETDREKWDQKDDLWMSFMIGFNFTE